MRHRLLSCRAAVLAPGRGRQAGWRLARGSTAMLSLPGLRAGTGSARARRWA